MCKTNNYSKTFLAVSVDQAEQIIIATTDDIDINHIVQDALEKSKVFKVFCTNNTEEAHPDPATCYTLTTLAKKVRLCDQCNISSI